MYSINKRAYQKKDVVKYPEKWDYEKVAGNEWVIFISYQLEATGS